VLQGIRYVYEQTQTEEAVSPEWMQTELMAAANASQQFTMEVWQEIIRRNEETGQQAMYQAMQITRIHDALSFLQTADLQRNQEQAIFRQRLSEWADRHQTATNQLMLEHQRLRNEVDTTQAAIRQVAGTVPTERRNVPSYLQAAPSASPTRRVRPPAIAMEDTDPTIAGLVPDQTHHQPPGRDQENRDEYLARVIAQTIATTLAANQPANIPVELRAPRVARLKLDNPAKFDGKPKTPFRTWWDSVRDYIRFYPETSGI
jgi:hypothetical protein